MKLKRVKIQNFKGLKDVEISFEDHGNEPRFLTCLVGKNGSGKTSVLQAIAFVLSSATRGSADPYSFRWNGFVAERMATHGPTRIDVEVELHKDERDALIELDGRWRKSQSDHLYREMDYSTAAYSQDVKLTYEHRSQPSFFGLKKHGMGFASMGRQYLDMISLDAFEKQLFLARVGDVFWFDQYRILGSGLLESGRGRPESSFTSAPETYAAARTEISWTRGVTSLREMLVGLWTFHKSERKGSPDMIEELQPRLESVFPGTRFVGVEPRGGLARPTQKDFFFLLERNGTVYDIAELSSGEQAVFEILYEFVRLNIARSIVLIDELELHLHPPQQQALLAALPKLGPDCQFIITTHSPYLEDVIPEEEIVRLEGGTVVS